MQTFEEAQETNQRLNRRLQALEGPWQQKVAKLQWECDHWSEGWDSTFKRLCKAHQELRLIYIEAAKVTGAPTNSFHSVMDGCHGWGDNPDHVFANVFVAGGVETIRVVDEVKRALAGQRWFSWWKRLLGRA